MKWIALALVVTAIVRWQLPRAPYVEPPPPAPEPPYEWTARELHHERGRKILAMIHVDELMAYAVREGDARMLADLRKTWKVFDDYEPGCNTPCSSVSRF